MDSDNLFRDPPPPEDKLPWLKIVRCPKGGKLRFCILSNRIEGVTIHRIGPKPVMCLGPACTLPDCQFNGRYQGYIEAILHVDGTVAMVELTADVANRLTIISVENGLDLRGLDIQLERVSDKRNAAITVAHMDTVTFGRDKRLARDLRPFILRLFKVR